MYFSLSLLCAIWLLRFATGNWCFGHPDAMGVIPKMGWGRQIINSFLHALQTFSMDEDYTAYMENGLIMACDIFNGHCKLLSALYVYLLNVIAPVAGGAFIFEILAGIFPQFRYTLSKCSWYKTRFYFTALNDPSLSLAKSIVSDPAYKHVLLIFTDVYSDDASEESSELLLSAKALGAICLKDDLLHISLKRFGKSQTYIFLSDREENENMQTLAQLLTPEKQGELSNTEISVLGSDNRISNIEDEVIYLVNRLTVEYENKNMSFDAKVLPVNGIRYMSQSLFYRLPLFEGLYGKSGDVQQLNVTIIGSGVIGTEMFLSAYCFGQMLGVELNINVVSAEETEQDFIDRIDGINPDIMATSRKGDGILNARIGEDAQNMKEIPQPRYFHFRYAKKDVISCDLDAFLKTGIGDDDFQLRDTDYFIVAAGSDEDNFLIAEKLRRAIGYYHLNEAQDQKTIISYVIYASGLCNALNVRSRQKYVHSADKNEFDVYMHAFGSMDEIYCTDNILRNNVRSRSTKIGEAYEKQQGNASSDLAKELKNRRYYNKRANDARGLYAMYKVYSAGLLQPTLFHTEDDEQYEKILNNAEENFFHHVNAVWTQPKYAEKLNALAWLEHRRWNAFMRINGFRKPDSIDKYIDLDSDTHCLKPEHDKSYQFVSIKLHPCLVECDLQGYPGACNKDPKLATKGAADAGPDELDVLNKRMKMDCKVYDYPSIRDD